MAKKAARKKTPDVINTIDTKVHPLPPGIYEGVKIVMPWRSRKTEMPFAVLPDGRVHVLYHSHINLADEGKLGMNDAIRRQYARLAGIEYNSLMEAIYAERAKKAEIRLSDDLNYVREQAQRLGYELKEIR